MAITNTSLVAGPTQWSTGRGGSGFIGEVEFDIEAPLTAAEDASQLIGTVANVNFGGATTVRAMALGMADGGNATLANAAGQGLTMCFDPSPAAPGPLAILFRNGVTGALDTPAAAANLRISLSVIL
mgnify:CR=1 FL=1